MARLAAILNALSRAVRRDLDSFSAIKVNNFFLFIALLIAGAVSSHVEPRSSYPFLLFLIFVMLFPLSSDPLDKIPPTRLALWPITPRERFLLRLSSIAVSPILWLAILLIVLRKATPVLASALLTSIVIVPVLSAFTRVTLPRFNAIRWIPRFPGRFGGLIQSNFRQMIWVLDLHLALILSVGGLLYRFLSVAPNPEATPILSLVVAMTMSTYAQCLFAFDRASSSMTRYRLLPLRGWQILLAKDLPYLIVSLLLVAFLDPLPGLTFALVALAVGHHAAVLRPVPMRRWRFAGGRILLCALQGVGGFALGMAAHQRGFVVLLAAVLLWLSSLFFYAWRWEAVS